jgi:hypothetical protein
MFKKFPKESNRGAYLDASSPPSSETRRARSCGGRAATQPPLKLPARRPYSRAPNRALVPTGTAVSTRGRSPAAPPNAASTGGQHRLYATAPPLAAMRANQQALFEGAARSAEALHATPTNRATEPPWSQAAARSPRTARVSLYIARGSFYLTPVVSATNRRSRGFFGGPAHIFIHFAVYVVLIWII